MRASMNPRVGVLVIAIMVAFLSLLTAVAKAATWDVSMDALVTGPTRTAAADKSLVAKVTNLGVISALVCDNHIRWDITINGSPTTGSVSSLTPSCTTLKPGASTRFKFEWTFGPGEPGAGATVAYTATIVIPDDQNAANNSDTETRIAK
jgi:hypothetical protein